MSEGQFQVVSKYQPAGDQPTAIEGLVQGVEDGLSHQTLLGVTGSGKTFTMANVIARLGRPAIIMAPNKTLAAQLYGEFKEFFPNNAVEYFVSYYDYYQPEAYVPSSDTFIEKDAAINEHIEQMRLSATRALLAHVQRWEPALHATYALDPDAALAQARASEARWQAGAPLGPLDGVPLICRQVMALREAGVTELVLVLGHHAKDIEAARLLVRQAAWMKDNGEKNTMYASMAKCFAADAAHRIASDAVHASPPSKPQDSLARAVIHYTAQPVHSTNQTAHYQKLRLFVALARLQSKQQSRLQTHVAALAVVKIHANAHLILRPRCNRQSLVMF